MALVLPMLGFDDYIQVSFVKPGNKSVVSTTNFVSVWIPAVGDSYLYDNFELLGFLDAYDSKGSLLATSEGNYSRNSLPIQLSVTAPGIAYVKIGNRGDYYVAIDDFSFSATSEVYPVDLLIKRGDESDSAFAINDEYQTTPSGDQIETQTVAAGKTATYQVKLENDGTEARTFKLRASEGTGAGWKVTYMVGSTNITNNITGNGYTTSTLSPGGSKIITIKMKSPGSAAYSASKSTTIEAYLDASDTTVRDAVQAVTTVSSGVPPSPTPTSTATVTPTPPPSDYLSLLQGLQSLANSHISAIFLF